MPLQHRHNQLTGTGDPASDQMAAMNVHIAVTSLVLTGILKPTAAAATLYQYIRYSAGFHALFRIRAAPAASARNIEYTVLYKREPSTTGFRVNTFWNDSMDLEKKRPKQTKVQLYADGSPYGSEVS